MIFESKLRNYYEIYFKYRQTGKNSGGAWVGSSIHCFVLNYIIEKHIDPEDINNINKTSFFNQCNKDYHALQCK